MGLLASLYCQLSLRMMDPNGIGSSHKTDAVVCVYVRALLFLVGEIFSFWSPPPCATVSKCVRVWWSKAGTRHTCRLIPLLIQSTCVISPAAAEGRRNILYRYTIRLFGPTVFGSSRLCYIQLSKKGTRRPQNIVQMSIILFFPFKIIFRSRFTQTLPCF
jgi:hypothetical protein